MSPASSGALEVERYIGACLISSQTRAKRYEYFVPGDALLHHQQQQIPQQKYHQQHLGSSGGAGTFRRCHSIDGWAGGMPLISFANHQRPRTKKQITSTVMVTNHPHSQQQPDDVHRTRSVQEGLSRLAVHTQGAPLILTQKYNNGRRNNVRKTNSQKDFNNSADTVSVASDESTGTTNTENTLPRIIKPRKRRKKDRKPPHLLQPFNHEEGLSTDSASPEVDLTVAALEMVAPYFPITYNRYSYNNNNQRTDIPMLKDNFRSDVSEAPKLHHCFEDVEDFKEDDAKDTASSCQCTYCNPADQIWDISKDRYSPFLTNPTKEKAFRFDNLGVSGNSQLPRQFVEAVSALSLGCDRGDSEKEVMSSRTLEISTEIVTSLNGHRDLEIKLFPSFSANKGVREVNNNVIEKCSSDNCGKGYGCFKSIMYRSLSLEE